MIKKGLSSIPSKVKYLLDINIYFVTYLISPWQFRSCFFFLKPFSSGYKNISLLEFYFLIFFKTKLGRFMYQPCVKFISHTLTYMVFIIMIIVSSVQFSEEQKNTKKFSNHLPNVFYNNYTTYSLNKTLIHKLHFRNLDFSLRRDQPSEMDIAITIWIIGWSFRKFQLFNY